VPDLIPAADRAAPPPGPPVTADPSWRWTTAAAVAATLFAYSGFGGLGGLLGIGKQWLRADYSHGFLVVPFAAYLLWRNRAALPARFAWPDPRGLPLVVLPLGVYFWDSSRNWAREWVQGACVAVSLAGVAVMFCGRWAGLRWAAPALVLLLLALPLPHRVEVGVNWQLQRVATVSAMAVFRTLGFATHLPTPVTIQLDTVTLHVAEPCSGLSMLMPFVALTAAIVLLCPPSRPRADRWVIFLSAIPIAVLCNVLRIVVSGLVLRAGWKEAFDLVIHDFAGWAMMLPALGLVWLEFRLIDWVLIPVTYLSREEVVKAGLAEARAEIAKQEADRKALQEALAARGGRPAGPGETHPAAPFLPLTRAGTSHGATAAGGTIATPADTPPPPEAPR
jgi:exosortase